MSTRRSAHITPPITWELSTSSALFTWLMLSARDRPRCSWHLRTDGVVLRALGQTPTLAEAQALVHGYVERVTLRGRLTLWVDEEGLLKMYRINPLASLLGRRHLVGDALLTTHALGTTAAPHAEKKVRRG